MDPKSDPSDLSRPQVSERANDEVSGTYNCPVCGWNEPHVEHAGELVRRLLAENANLGRIRIELGDVAREIAVHIENGHSFVSVNRVVDVSTLKSWLSRIERRAKERF